MQSHQTGKSAHLPCDHQGRRIKRTSSFVLGQLIVSLAGLPLASTVANAQSTSCANSANCFDLYQGTITAMQTAAPNAQPSEFSSMTYTGNGAQFFPVSFTGGTLLSGPMTYNLANTPPNQENTTLTTWTGIACPNSGGAQGTYTLESTYSNQLTLTSDTSVENTSSTFMEGSAEVSIEYTSPALTGGVDPGASLAFDYGQEYESSTATSYGTSTDSGTESTISQEINYNIPEGYAQTFSLVGQTSVYSSVPWSAPVMLAGTLNSVTYAQQFKSFPSSNLFTTQQVNYNGTMVNANVWLPPQIWYAEPPPGGAMGGLASPSGAYMYLPTQYADLAGWFLSGAGSLDTIYYEGQWYGTYSQGMQLRLDSSCDTSAGCAGSFWGTNYAGSETAWDSNTSPQYLAMQDDGNLVGYSANWSVLWSSKSGKGVVPAPQINATPTPTPSQVLPPSGQSFIASGTYASQTLTSNAWVQYGPQVALTQDQINTCNGMTTTSSLNAPKSTTLAAAPATPETEAGYALVKTSTSTAPMQLAQNDDRRRDDPRLNNEQRRQNLRQDVEQRQKAQANPDAVQASPVNPDEVRKAKDRNKVTKLKKLKSPMVLKPSQYYATDLSVFKVVKLSVRSDNLNNKFITVPGPSSVSDLPTPIERREVRLKPRLHKTFSVKPRETI